MDERESPVASDSIPDLPDTIAPTPEEARIIDETSGEFLGRWNRLISTTNWEKGRIIAEWRGALIEAGAPPGCYADEAWSRRVGNVTPQHAGRLRRVYQRFGRVHDQYEGLYWSHFQAALDWSDAEMWLEGAVQSGWSVSQMREQRWEAIGAPPDRKPRPGDVIATELDEDVRPDLDRDAHDALSGSYAEVRGGDTRASRSADAKDAVLDEPSDRARQESPPATAPFEPVRPFEDLPALPSDLNEAFEAFKLAILAHKIDGWRDVSCEDVLATLDALRQLAVAPA